MVKNVERLGEGRIDFVRLPKATAFHATGDDDGLAGNVAGERVGREKDRGVGDVVRPGDLWEGHRGRDPFDHCGIA